MSSKDIKEQNISTEDDIVQKLHGKEMELEDLFRTYFQAELDDKNKSGSSIIATGLTVTATDENDNMTYKTLPSWQKTKYDRLADEGLKALYLETIREEREKNELNLDIIKVALISLVNISMDVLNKGHNDDESIKTFMLILNAVVDGILLLVIILKIVRMGLFYNKEYFNRIFYILFPVVVVIILFSILLKVDISPNIAIYWVDAGLLCSELLLKVEI
ncbi:hypothetical protein C1645_829531 [Glomus cerebriforme]|uniref:Uncharacterized protein n=1 Tax=Glomus cerebriforme TaxID=658196 RepID=A0A397SNT4_9GLOM|nr:hypothetical protein C1645_829531 [Glomus cerebriforme]